MSYLYCFELEIFLCCILRWLKRRHSPSETANRKYLQKKLFIKFIVLSLIPKIKSLKSICQGVQCFSTKINSIKCIFQIVWSWMDPETIPLFTTKNKVIQWKDVVNMYGKSSKKCCFLKKNANTFITIWQLYVWYLVLYIWQISSGD